MASYCRLVTPRLDGRGSELPQPADLPGLSQILAQLGEVPHKYRLHVGEGGEGVPGGDSAVVIKHFFCTMRHLL